MNSDILQLLALLFVGSIFWVGGYWLQRAKNPSTIVVKPPRWVVWLCGNPRGDGQLEIDDASSQLLGLTLLTSSPCLFLWVEDYRTRAGIAFGTIIIFFGVSGLIQLSAMYNRQYHVQSFIQTSFAFLVAEYDFKGTESWFGVKAPSFIFKSQHCLIRIYLDFDCIHITIGPNQRKSSWKLNRLSNEITLPALLYCLKLETQVSELNSLLSFSKRDEIPFVLDRIAQMIRNRLKPILAGDFSHWPQPEKCELEYIKATMEHAASTSKPIR
jgi:hypothetical protein